jgi:DNA replication protein DnaC
MKRSKAERGSAESKTAREVAKAFERLRERDGKAVPVSGAERLEAEVEGRKRAKIARLQAEIARMEAAPAAVSREDEDGVDVGALGPEIEAVLAGMAARVKLPSAEELRAHRFETQIVPTLKRWGFRNREWMEVREWTVREQGDVFARCGELLRGVGSVVAMIGERGAGKTTIAAQLAVALAWRMHDARRDGDLQGAHAFCAYRKVTDLVARLKPLYANFGTIETERLEKMRDALCRHELLVIDEMHDMIDLPVREAMLIDVIDRRYASLRDTVLISNQTKADWDAKTNPSIVSRLRQHGAVLVCDWGSWRDPGGIGGARLSGLPF